MSDSAAACLKLGLVGHPVSHSLSPLMHKAALSFLKLSGTYDLIDCAPANLPSVAARMRQSYNGFNVTIPHKQAIMPLLDELTAEARIVKAVNTVRVEGGRMIGHNTDTDGFLTSLKATAGSGFIFPIVCILGSGGAARAALWSVARIGAEQVVIVARTLREARAMQDELSKQSKSPPQIILRSPGEALNTRAPSLIVNCTPIGLAGDQAAPPWIVAIMQAAMRGTKTPVFFDMVYSRSSEPTPLVKQALALGLKACDGLQMLVEQAAASFHFFTGIKVESSIMAAALADKQAFR